MNISPEQIDLYMDMVISADNAAFMSIVETTNNETLRAVVDRFQLPLDSSRHRRLALMFAVRREIARRRREVALQNGRQ